MPDSPVQEKIKPMGKGAVTQNPSKKGKKLDCLVFPKQLKALNPYTSTIKILLIKEVSLVKELKGVV